jgi:hypothetical chaperone protein
VYCAIDFGTSNSGIAVPAADAPGDAVPAADAPGAAVRLLEIEPGRPTMPTAVFYAVEGLAAHEAPRRLHGSAAIAAYVEGSEGRLMRSMKSIPARRSPTSAPIWVPATRWPISMSWRATCAI